MAGSLLALNTSSFSGSPSAYRLDKIAPVNFIFLQYFSVLMRGELIPAPNSGAAVRGNHYPADAGQYGSDTDLRLRPPLFPNSLLISALTNGRSW